MFKKPHDLEPAAHEAEIAEPQETDRIIGNVNIEVEFEDTLGAALLGAIAIALMVALLLVIRQNRALVTQLGQGA